MSIEIANIKKSFGRTQVLNDISLDIPSGQMVALLGPSGSGKTTLLRAVAGLEKPTSGRIAIGNRTVYDGTPRSEIPAEERNLGLVFQSYALWPHKTVFDNVAYPLKLRKVAAGEIKERVQRVLDQLGLGHLGNRHPHQLSGGQQQRVAIARALASSPQIILFDEPTSALDPEMIGEVLQVMKTLAHSGITMLVVTHEMQFAREIADRVVFIDGGDILEVAPPAEFFAHPQHARARRFLQKVLDPLHQESLE